MNEVTNLSKIDTVTVHNGVFHADDVATVALIEIILERDVKVIRTRDVETIEAAKADEACLVADVGNGDFDHHGQDNQSNKFGIPHAAVGKVFNWVIENVGDLPDGAFKQAAGKPGFKPAMDDFYEAVLSLIELTDNKGLAAAPNPLVAIIASFNSMPGDPDDNFREAVKFAKIGLVTALEAYIRKVDLYSQVASSSEKAMDHIVVENQYFPAYMYGKVSDRVWFEVSPSVDGNWQINAVDSRVHAIAVWDASEVIFQHPGRFVTKVRTKDLALAIAKASVGE